MRFWLAALFLSGASATAAGAIPIFSETLSQAEARALRTSPALQSSAETYQAAEFQARASKADLFPRLSLDANYFYQTHVTSADLAELSGFSAFPLPSTSGIEFGTHHNYSFGPTLTYTFFDAGRRRSAWNSNKSIANARGQDEKTARRQLVLNLRLAYFNVQFSLKSLALTADSLKLVQAQNHDVQIRFNAGAASRLDAVNAKRQVLQYQLTFRQSQNTLDAALRSLFAIMGASQEVDTRRAIPLEIAENLPSGIDPPTLFVELDSIERTLAAFRQKKLKGLDPAHPQLQSLAFTSQAQRQASDAYRSALWPRLTASARSEYVYPDLVNPKTVQQNIFSVTFSLPLFEADLSRNQAAQNLRASMASELQREQTQIDLMRNWQTQHDLVESLLEQLSLSDENAREATIAAKLTYQSYRAGSFQYLDVVAADVRRLEAQVNAASVRTQILSSTAQLDYLGVSP